MEKDMMIKHVAIFGIGGIVGYLIGKSGKPQAQPPATINPGVLPPNVTQGTLRPATNGNVTYGSFAPGFVMGPGGQPVYATGSRCRAGARCG